ncbi:2'-5' RNA ligase family protein [Vulcanisaeta sp. JCM 16161]|uniref:2'-5' RNA ligase family protein n=1 Tax=Vulcanisaeta sp. JCM 16161 TaxID=1295372 RepID=UPI00406C9DAA
MGFFYGVFTRDLDVAPLIRALPVIPMDSENMHITIAYIGDKRPSQEVDDRVGVSLNSIPCFRVKLGQLMLLPSALKPRVLAVEVINNEQLSRLRSVIISILRDSSVPMSDKYSGEFKPHITIAYIKTKKIDPQEILETAYEIGIESKLQGKSLLIDNVSLILARENNYREISRHELQCPSQY